MAFEYYDFIGVDRQAIKDDVNRACKKKRRSLSVEKDNTGLQYLNQVQQTLLDDLSRKSYDEMQEFGDEITELLEQASEKMEVEAWLEASRLLKRLLVLSPQQLVARNLLGMCLVKLEDYDVAEKVFSKLEADYPEKPVYWANAGYLYLEKAAKCPSKLADGTLLSECPNCEEYNTPFSRLTAFQYQCEHCGEYYQIPAETKEIFLEKARASYLQAIHLEPYNPSHYIQVAEAYSAESRYSEGVAWAEKAITADGKEDFDDLDNIFYLCRLYSLMKEPKKMEEVAARIAALVPANIAEAREYAVYKFGDFAYELSELSLFEPAANFAKCALVIDPNHEAAGKLFEYCESVALAENEYDRLHDDYQLIEPIKRLAAFSLCDAWKTEIEDRDNVIENILEQFNDFPVEQFLSSLRRLKQQYPGTFRLDREFYDDSEMEASKKITTQPSSNPSLATNGGCGIILLLISGIISFIAMIGISNFLS